MKPTASLCFALGMAPAVPLACLGFGCKRPDPKASSPQGERHSVFLSPGLWAQELPPECERHSLSLFLPASGICQIVLAPGPPPPPLCYRAFGGIVEILFPPEVPFQGLQVTISLSLPLSPSLSQAFETSSVTKPQICPVLQPCRGLRETS